MPRKSELLRKWQLISPYLHRKQRIIWAAAEAAAVGPKGCHLLAGVTGISVPTLAKWIERLEETENAAAGSLIPPKGNIGAGRKFTEANDPEIEPALQKLLSEEIAGDPMGCQKWVRSSLRNLSKRLGDQGHQACTHTVARLLRKMGYSLQVAKKKQAGADHPDRDEQFKYIASLKAKFRDANYPVISIDTKKKELIGNFRREGKTWRREPLEVDTHFASYAQCLAVPFGIYDLSRNTGYITVGISHNTSEFAVNCLANWWKLHGRAEYANADRMLILADGGGGNGYNLRTWKRDLQDKLCEGFGLTVTVSHYPTACSKWNPIEYRLFSHISMNWAGQPLTSLDVMLAFIRGTTTANGLKVEACLDQEIYRKGRKVTDRELKQLAISTHDVCPRWNYTLSPRRSVNGQDIPSPHAG